MVICIDAAVELRTTNPLFPVVTLLAWMESTDSVFLVALTSPTVPARYTG
jgi:hypothetical protein